MLELIARAWQAAAEQAAAASTPNGTPGQPYTDQEWAAIDAHHAEWRDYASTLEDEYHGVTCSNPHDPQRHNDECAVWWLRGTPRWRLAHTNLSDA